MPTTSIDKPIQNQQLESKRDPKERKKNYPEFGYYAEDGPLSFQEATTGNEAKDWKEAISEESNSMKENGVWEIAPLPNKGGVIGCPCVFNKKFDPDGKIQGYIARLVAQGFSQIQGIDYHETLSLVVRYESIKMLLAHVINHDMLVRQIDIKTAFLYGKIDCEVYMAIPEGIIANQRGL
jgi:hypothetical protein